jgi:protein-tyrosine phosphatase
MRSVPGFSLESGHSGDLQNLNDIHENGIRALIDLAQNEKPIAPPRDIVYCRFPLIDGTGNPAWLLHLAVNTVSQLLRAHMRTLIYCSAGMSRTPCIAAAAISQIHGCSLSEAITIATQSGPADISPGLWSDVQKLCS